MARGNDTDKYEYVVERIVRHTGKGDTFRNVVSWYGYGLEEDTVDPANRIPYYLITRYFRRLNKKSRKTILEFRKGHTAVYSTQARDRATRKQIIPLKTQQQYVR